LDHLDHKDLRATLVPRALQDLQGNLVQQGLLVLLASLVYGASLVTLDLRVFRERLDRKDCPERQVHVAHWDLLDHQDLWVVLELLDVREGLAMWLVKDLVDLQEPLVPRDQLV